MKKIRLGRTGLMVSELAMGCIPIMRLEFDQAVELVRYCFDQGITFFDTARAYADSEAKVGKALKGVREKVVLASKSMGRDTATIAKHLAASLADLRTSWIDIYQLHNVSNQKTLDEVLSPQGAYQALAEAKKQGKIKHIGISCHNLEIAAKACLTGLFDTVQVPFNFVEKEAAEKLFPVARSQDMGIIGMKPLAGGLLDRADLCFSFLQQYPEVVPDPGLQFRHEAEEVLAMYRSPRPLKPEQLAEMERIRQEMGPRFCHRCEYCLPCPQNVLIPWVFSFRSMARRFPPARVLDFCQKAMESAANCTQCGECQEKCPYELPIPEMIQEYLAEYQEFTRRHAKK
jgi:predicted aldo/keto reductase-like oxidoreductase